MWQDARRRATYCGLPLYRAAPAMRIANRAGMHRFSWDVRFEPVIEEDIDGAGD